MLRTRIRSADLLGTLFERVPVLSLGTGGTPYTRWIPFGMPKLGEYQFLLDIVFFLYPDAASAVAGKDAGGTGFFVAIPAANYPDKFHHVYAVTNWHVALDGSPVIRVNRQVGAPEIFELEPHEWFFIPGDHDIAVVPLDLNPATTKAQAIEAESFFLTEDQIKASEINAAEDVFMLGRFIDYDGVEVNVPSMRFGNISMMAARVKQPTGFTGDSYVVDMHSRTGFSGSPVFVYRTPGAVFAKNLTLVAGGHMMKLLGILWGQFPEEWDLQDKKKAQSAVPPVLDGKTIKGMSGMSLVSPASAIRRVLDMPELKKRRQQVEKGLHEHLSSAPAAQSASPQSSDENPNARGDFNRLLNAAAQKRPQGGQT